MNEEISRYSRKKATIVQRRGAPRIIRLVAVLLICLVFMIAVLPRMGRLVNTGLGEFSGVPYDTSSIGAAVPDNQRHSISVQPSNSDDWKLILVNKWNPLPDDYDVALMELSNGQRVDSRIYQELQAMFDAARAKKVYPIVAAGYRTTEKQQSLMDERIAEFIAEGCSEAEAREDAEKWVAIPGTSEHQLGLAVDINADGIHSKGYDVYDWLAENAHYYGFVLRYADNKSDITGIYNEPWHYRYVGVKAATDMYESGLCLEEYLTG